MKRFAGLALLCLCVVARASLLSETEGLRDSLPTDDPARQTLGLRLADLLFNEASAPATEPVQASRDREKAIGLYEDALSGSQGRFRKAEGTLRLKIRFQLARLYSDEGQATKAESLWRELAAPSAMPEIQREAALRLAEIDEKRGDAEAERYYRLALELARGTDVAPYVHYRLAWTLKKRGTLDSAIAELELALWDSKGQVREEALRELVVWYAQGSTLPATTVAKVETLAERLSRPALLQALAEAYFAVGNKDAGILALGAYQAKAPSATIEARLVEESYGLRKWEQFRAGLARMREKGAAAPSPELEKILLRLAVQLDAERVTDPSHASDFQQVAELYLDLFPTSDQRIKLMQGWLAVEQSRERKIERLGTWLKSSGAGLSPKDVRALSETRAKLAGEAKDWTTVADEMARCLSTGATESESRQYRFTRAAALLELKRTDEALPLLETLAQSESGDALALKSEWLWLNALADRKQYAAVAESARAWIRRHPGRSDKTSQAIEQLASQSRFEAAAAAGATPQALETFREFCAAKKFLPKSCENAKVLAVRLKDQGALLTVLEVEGKNEELASEYEASGHFLEAARAWEKSQQTKGASLQDELRVALLYELGGDLEARDQIVRKLERDFTHTGKIGPAEESLFLTMKDASLLGAGALKFPWTEPYRCRVANEIALRAPEDAATKKRLLACATDAGPAWRTAVVDEVRAEALAQAKLGFHGKASKERFDRRLKALERVKKMAERYLLGADQETRATLAGILESSYRGLGEEILGTPMPAGVEASEAQELRAALQKMAEPFLASAREYRVLADRSLAARTQTATVPENKDLSPSSRQEAISRLNASPSDPSALATLKAYYTGQGRPRLAAYFEGRLRESRKEQR